MNQFISDNPALVSLFLGSLVTLITLLGSLLIWFVKRSFDNLCKAINDLKGSIDSDKKEIIDLSTRMQRQETTCDMQRASCHHHSRSTDVTPSMPPIHPSMAQVKNRED